MGENCCGVRTSRGIGQYFKLSEMNFYLYGEIALQLGSEFF